MRTSLPWIAIGLSALLQASGAHAEDALYRCESTTGVSIQSAPCPKDAIQKKISFQRPAGPAPGFAPAGGAPAPAPAPAPPAAPLATVGGHPVTPTNAMRGPNDPYPLWQCMRGDGSTYDSRDGVPGRQWVVASPEAPDAADTSEAPGGPSPEAMNAALAKQMEKTGGVMSRPYSGPATSVSDPNAPREAPPPPGAGPGQWVADQCSQLPPEQACKRYAARRDALRRQIYAALPSQRPLYAPEEQDLTTMLYAACGM